MPSRRDQLQAYRLTARRVIHAFLLGEPDPADSPIPNSTGLLFGSIMLAVLLAAGAALAGVLGR